MSDLQLFLVVFAGICFGLVIIFGVYHVADTIKAWLKGE
jgi:hypothetical protein